MSITPFLPGLPAPVPTDAGTPATGEPADPGVVFGDALAAALLATVPLPTTPTAVVEEGGVPAPPVVEVRGVPAPPVVEVRAPASLETTGPDAGTGPLASLPAAPSEVSRLVAGAPRTSTAEVAPEVSRLVAGAPHTSTAEDTTGPEAGGQPLANLPAAAPEVSRLVAGAPHTSTAGASTLERAVVQQVFPEVTHLVATTPADRPGTHRITLTLQPEQLGEVRVTLVVKDGAVQVRLAGSADDAAGSAAVHRALSSGVPELQRLLERSGATEARVLVRDPFNPTPAPQPTAPTAPVAATSQTSSSTVSADAGRDGASAWNRSSGDSDQRRHRRDVPEPPPLAPVPSTTPTTSPAGHLDRTL